MVERLRQEPLERRVCLGEHGIRRTRHHLALRGQLELVRATVGRVRDPLDEPAVDEPLDVVAQRRQRHARDRRDRGRRDGLRVPDVRDEPELVRRDPGGTEPVLEDPHDVATGHRHLEEEPVVPHEGSVADAAPTQ